MCVIQLLLTTVYITVVSLQEIYHASISSIGTLWLRVLHNLYPIHQEGHLMAFLATNSIVYLNSKSKNVFFNLYPTISKAIIEVNKLSMQFV